MHFIFHSREIILYDEWRNKQTNRSKRKNNNDERKLW